MNRPVPPIRPRRAVLLSCLAAWPALAEAQPLEGTQVRSWGEEAMAHVMLVPGEEHPATVVFENRLTFGNPSEMVFVLSIDGLAVEVLMSLGAGDEPDMMTVRVPPGFLAEPAESIEVAEGETGHILVRPMPMS